MAALNEATIGLIRVDYEEGALTVAAIGEKYGVSASYVCRLARERGWLMRTDRLGRRPRTSAALSATGRALIAHRLCGVINKKIDQMEKDMESGALSSADLERDSKTIASMIGGMHKVIPVPIEDKVSKPDAAPSTAVANTDEVERLQREIIERFERIQSRREVEGRSL
jgi:hypothetical protein